MDYDSLLTDAANHAANLRYCLSCLHDKAHQEKNNNDVRLYNDLRIEASRVERAINRILDGDDGGASKASEKTASMKPSQLASQLRRIAAAIDKSRNPDRTLVARDLKKVLASVRTAAHPHNCLNDEESTNESWWEYDARDIPLVRVCEDCRDEKLSHYRPEILSGYDQSDVDEPIEPDDY